jgi:hypothetical protein
MNILTQTGVDKAGLPKDSEIEEAFDQNHILMESIRFRGLDSFLN